MLRRNTGAGGGVGIGSGGIGGMGDSMGSMYGGGSIAANMRPDSSSGLSGGIGGGRGGMMGMRQDYGGIQGSGPRGQGGQTLGQMASNLSDDQKLDLRVYNFVVQFIWVETPPSERDRIKTEKLQAELEKQALDNPMEPSDLASGTMSPNPTVNDPMDGFDPGNPLENNPEEAAF